MDVRTNIGDEIYAFGYSTHCGNWIIQR